MRIEDLSRTHWIIIALLLGAAMAWLQTNWSTSNLTQTHSQSDMEAALLRNPVKGTDGSVHPWIRGITIYPAVEAGIAQHTREGDVRQRKSAVAYQMLRVAPDRKGWYYQSAVTLVDDPYKPFFNQPARGSIADHFIEAGRNRDWIRFRCAWWIEPQYAYPIWIGGFLLIVGIVWPILLNRLVAAGYGRAPEDKGPSLLKRLFTRAPRRPAYVEPAKAPPVLSQEELDRIAKMEDDLKDFMAGQGDKELGGEFDENAAPAIRELNAMPLEAPAPEKAEEAKDYGGEFYPTVAHGHAKKKPEDK